MKNFPKWTQALGIKKSQKDLVSQWMKLKNQSAEQKTEKKEHQEQPRDAQDFLPSLAKWI